MSESILAWHFVGAKLRDGSAVPRDGVWLKYDGPLVVCQSGLHASRDPFDALQYAPGAILCRVECRGEIVNDTDKFVCRERRILARKDATEGLYYFARLRALSVAHLWDAPDVVLDYLMTGSKSAAAHDAAYAAAYAAAPHVAAYATAYAAARATARATARAAAYVAAYATAYFAAHAAAHAAAYVAARDAAYDAAYAAARDAAHAEWNDLVNEAFWGKP